SLAHGTGRRTSGAGLSAWAVGQSGGISDPATGADQLMAADSHPSLPDLPAGFRGGPGQFGRAGVLDPGRATRAGRAGAGSSLYRRGAGSGSSGRRRGAGPRRRGPCAICARDDSAAGYFLPMTWGGGPRSGGGVSAAGRPKSPSVTALAPRATSPSATPIGRKNPQPASASTLIRCSRSPPWP